MKQVRVGVECAQCQRCVERTISLPDDMEDRVSYIVVEHCSACRTEDQRRARE